MNKSEAAKKRVGKTKKERSENMRALAVLKWSRVSFKKRKEHCAMMIRRRKSK